VLSPLVTIIGNLKQRKPRAAIGLSSTRVRFEIAEDLDSNNSDPRTHAQIMLEKIKSLLEGKADVDVANYSVAGRSLTKLSFDELIKARDYYQEEFNKELIAERIRKKQPTGATVKVRFL
jgi:hypothetical protein